MRFLHNGGSRMLPLLAIVNSYIDLQVLEGAARGTAAAAAAAAEEELEDGEGPWGAEGEPVGDTGPAPADAATAVLVNRTEIKLGLLQVRWPVAGSPQGYAVCVCMSLSDCFSAQCRLS
ncbi:hypothetical protein Vretimale_3968 [Volvox reticuliferus]|uniref:Uncharacterized protein n=1 Tax=Volvox reticuliferus TaxID=1737510 RepID=A0A8J4D9S7_9CHLO|nr:hypothetical protein Vretimale_3968 [Volvox reticuliferus]